MVTLTVHGYTLWLARGHDLPVVVVVTLAVLGYMLWLTRDGLPVVAVVTLAVHGYTLWLTGSRWLLTCGTNGDVGCTRVYAVMAGLWRLTCCSSGDFDCTRVYAVTDSWWLTCGSGGDVGCTQVYAVTDWHEVIGGAAFDADDTIWRPIYSRLSGMSRCINKIIIMWFKIMIIISYVIHVSLIDWAEKFKTEYWYLWILNMKFY